MMFLEEIEEKDFMQDNWSLGRPVFGSESNITVLGWYGRNNNGNGSKRYIVSCNICQQDPELFGRGYFQSEKGSMLRGSIPCGCSMSFRWTKEQYTLLCNRKGAVLNCHSAELFADWKGLKTKFTMLCQKHGKWQGDLNSFLVANIGCKQCGTEKVVAANQKPMEDMIIDFMKTGSFAEGTQFKRSDRKARNGYRPFCYVICPVCLDEVEARICNLKKGAVPCMCSKIRTREAYIHTLKDGALVVALKFGISVNSVIRRRVQNLKCTYSVQPCAVYKFPSLKACKMAELECKQELECGVILKRDMPDGYTETTWVYNLEKIEEIYKRNGGIKNEDQ